MTVLQSEPLKVTRSDVAKAEDESTSGTLAFRPLQPGGIGLPEAPTPARQSGVTGTVAASGQLRHGMETRWPEGPGQRQLRWLCAQHDSPPRQGDAQCKCYVCKHQLNKKLTGQHPNTHIIWKQKRDQETGIRGAAGAALPVFAAAGRRVFAR
ncbi:TPA: hypothetical protein JG951_003153 [Enterobacter hormaechei subsp. steigerwaltii]|nr:hypothetical protein [Enterobacter hormaechei subsp. steigerwaltii]